MCHLLKELAIQGIDNFRLWDGIIDESEICRGISKAHKQIVKWARDSNLKEVAIAEDDIEFSDMGAYDFFLENKPEDFDIYLGGITWGKIQNDQRVEDFSGCVLYIVNERFYDFVLGFPENKNYDRAMAGLGKFIVCDPFVASQCNGYSDNQKRIIDFGPIVRRMKWFKR